MERKILYAQPLVNIPHLRYKDLQKGVYRVRFLGDFHFTDVGRCVWKTAKSLDENAEIKPAVEKKKLLEWDVLISTNELWILLEAWYYRGFWDVPENMVVSIEFNGDDGAISEFVKHFVKSLGREPLEIKDWQSFVQCFKVTKENVISQWKYYLGEK